MKRAKNVIIILFATLSGVSFGIAASTFLLMNGYFSSSYRAFVVQSGSMEPAISVGSFIFTKSYDEYAIGDVITFEVNKNTVTHRINAILYENGEAVYKTKGDANEEQDNWTINKSQIIGKSTLNVPYLGYLSSFVRTPKGFVALVVIPASIIIYEELKNITREIKKLISKSLLQNKSMPFPRRRESNENDSGSRIKSGMTKLIIPMTGVVLLVVGGSLSYFYDLEQTDANILQAGEWESDDGIADTLVINEVLADSSCFQGNTEAQFIEIYNGYDYEVALKDYKITDGNNVIDLVTAASIIAPPKGLVLLSHNSAIWNHCYDDNAAITGNLGGQLNIDTGILQLLDSGDNVIDTVIWGESPLNPTQDNSIERTPKGADSAFGVNFNVSDFMVNIGVTPGL